MPIVPNAVKSSKSPTTAEGGSPRGWTFLGLANECWRAWALKYVFGLVPATKADALETGSAYHELLEGVPLEEVKKHFPDHADEAAEFAADRVKNGPPLGKGVAVEKTYALFGGLMTSKPDRVEQVSGSRVTRIRDFKTTGTFSENDELIWGIDMGIMGEVLAGIIYEKGDTKGVVDIQRKWKTKEGDERAGNNTKIITVTLTEDKRRALEAMVRNTWSEIDQRLLTLSRGDSTLDDAFPQRVKGCISKYGPCPYYARCWLKGDPSFYLYKLVTPARRWIGKGSEKELSFKNDEPKKDVAVREKAVLAIYKKHVGGV